MATRAVRNNNPGNLVLGNRIVYPGQIGNDSNGFAIFNSWDAGVAAASANLESYANRGWDTPYEIAHNWSKTDQDAYTANLANALGVTANTPVNLHDAATRNKALNAIFTQEDNNYKATTNPLTQSWEDIMKAAETGNPITAAFSVTKAVFDGAHGVMNGAFEAGAQAGASAAGSVSNALNFDIGTWIEDQLGGAAKDYIIPLALGTGALLLILASSWGLVKDTSAGQTIKAGTKAAGMAMFI